MGTHITVGQNCWTNCQTNVGHAHDVNESRSATAGAESLQRVAWHHHHHRQLLRRHLHLLRLRGHARAATHERAARPAATTRDGDDGEDFDENTGATDGLSACYCD